MIKKVIKKMKLTESGRPAGDVKYWLAKSAQERAAAVDHLRFQAYGHSIRLQRSARVIQQISD